MIHCIFSLSFFFFNDTATTEIYTLSLHDALPISTASAVGVPSGICHTPNPSSGIAVVLLRRALDCSVSRLLSRRRDLRGARASLAGGRAALQCEEALLALDPPAVAARAAVFPDGAVARDHQRDRVRRARPADRPRCAGLAETPGDVAVGARRAVRDRPQLFPDAPLEGGGLNVQRQIQAGLMAFQVPHDRADPAIGVAVAPADLRGRILFGERGLERAVGIAQVDRAD